MLSYLPKRKFNFNLTNRHQNSMHCMHKISINNGLFLIAICQILNFKLTIRVRQDLDSNLILSVYEASIDIDIVINIYFGFIHICALHT